MSDIDVHEIKLNLRYPNSRQEDITDAFMRGYQGAVKIGNDAVRRVKAEKAALERRIDELCAEVEYNRQTSRSRLERIDQLKDENAKLCARIDELCAENERLRQELAIRESSEQEKVIDYLGKECVDWEDKYLALAGENAKLRKLASDMRWCLNDKCSWCQRFGRSCSTERDRQALGIEVGI